MVQVDRRPAKLVCHSAFPISLAGSFCAVNHRIPVKTPTRGASRLTWRTGRIEEAQ
jgi:hypothetical protein